MRVEHIAFNVADPRAVADWYVRHLGMRVLRQGTEPPYTTFMADDAGSVVFEIYNNPPDGVPNYAEMDPLLFHIAFACEDIDAWRKRLLAAGASITPGTLSTPAGDQLQMMRDPWGLAIQLVKRVAPML